MIRTLSIVALLSVAFGGAARVRADIYELKDGGQVTGTLEGRTDDGAYIVRTADGAQTTLNRSQLQRIVPQDDTLVEYQKLAHSTPDTADGHRMLVKWCREHKLEGQVDHHLQRIADLDPNDEEARRSMGMVRVGDKWLSRDDANASHGLKFFDGKPRTAQDIAIRQRDGASGSVEANWVPKLKLWRGWLDSNRNDRVADAQANFASLNDRAAVPALVKLMHDERDESVFEMLLGTMGRIDDPLTITTLVGYSLDYDEGRDHGAKVREDCIDYLKSLPHPVSVLPYVQALKSKDNIIVNRAGKALEEINNPAAISPLIDALVTKHKYQVQTGGGPGSMNASFDPSGGGGGGLSMGGGNPKIIEEPRDNPDVLRALTKLSHGEHFEYDKRAWRRWYVDLQSRQQTNARRDQ